jgi:membrane protease YdiL (CAAX protease family)
MEDTPPGFDSTGHPDDTTSRNTSAAPSEEQQQDTATPGHVDYVSFAPSSPGFADMFTALFSGLLAGAVAGALAGLFLSSIYGSQHMRDHMPMLVTITMPFQFCVGLWATWYFACAKYHRSIRDGFQIRGVTGSQMLRYIGIAVLLTFIAMFALALAHAISPSSVTGKSLAVKVIQNKTTAMFWMAFALIAPITEELYFRGLAFEVLQRKFNTRAAVYLITAAFAGVHFPQLRHDWPALIGITCTSATVTVLRARTGSVTPGLIIHFVYNSILVSLSLLSSSVRP